MVKYIIDTGDIYNGQHVSDEEDRTFLTSLNLAKKEFKIAKDKSKIRDNSYVLLLKYYSDKCIEIINTYYNYKK